MGAVSAVLLIGPLVAMRFTAAVDWTGSDFAAAALLLAAVAVTVEVAWRGVATPRRRTALIGLAIVAGMAIWAHGAVGIV